MYESDGREQSYRMQSYGMTSRYHTYGQQLGWHALFLVAGRLLKECPVTDDSFYDDPWPVWLNEHLLTRQDGLWLSDGMDRTPLEINVNLLEKGKDGLVVTGNKSKILQLAGLDAGTGKMLVVEGSWRSNDGIKVNIASALVTPRRAKALAKLLIEEEPMIVWLPAYEEYEDDQEYVRNNKSGNVPWIVCPAEEAKLDKDDPLGATCAIRRPRLAREFASTFSLRTNDPFKRVWKNVNGQPLARAEAWGYENKYSDEEGLRSGVRLLCSSRLLKDVLSTYNADLLLLITLQRYEKASGLRGSRFTHTVAVVRVKKTLDVEFYKGRINYLHKPLY